PRSPSSRSLSPSRPFSPSEAAAIQFTHPDHLLTPPLSPINRTAKYHIIMRGGDRYERGADLLSPLETFEHYENRARSPQSASGQWASEQPPQPPTRYTSNRDSRHATRQTQGYNQGVRSAISHRSPTYPQPIHSSNGQLACEYRAQPQSYAPQQATRSYDTRPSTVACEYRADPRMAEPLRPLITDYRSNGIENGRQQGNAAYEYRGRDVSPSVRTTVTSYQPRAKDKLPLRWIICIAICVPLFIIICIMVAVQLQELGIL
ncbi:hypothetical protein PMAYCL1PPCAC_23362, partial [Pristionchus mayeri]